MNKKQRILFVLPFLPYPLTSGGSQAVFNGIDAVKDDLEVYVAFEATAADKDNIEKFKSLLDGKVTVCPYYVPSPKSNELTLKQRLYRPLFKTEKKLRKLAGYDFTPIRVPHKSWLPEELFPKRMGFAKHVCGIVDEYGFDIVQCEMLCNVTLGLVLPNRGRKVFVHHELGWVVHELEFQTQKGDAFEQKMYLDYYKMCEVALLNTYDDVIALSSIDAEKLLKAGVIAKIHTSLAVVKTPQDAMLSTNGWNKLSFVGPDCNLPNVEGIKWFLANVWKQLLQKDSSYRLQIIGHWAPNHIAEVISEHENVEYLGFVEDLPSVLKNTIMIVPITVGSGIRMKILESAAMGAPFVTTSVGVEGIPVTDGEHCLVADTPEDFMNAIMRLKDEQLRKQLAFNANRLVKERYTLEALRKNRLEVYNTKKSKEE